MKKLFLFQSSASTSGNNSPVPSPSTGKQAYWENPSDSGVNDQATDKVGNSFQSPRGLSKTRKQVHESQTSGSSPCPRPSLSSSSAVLHKGGLGQKNLSRFSDHAHQQRCKMVFVVAVIFHSSDSVHISCRILTPERQSRPKCFETAVVQNAHGVENPSSASSSRGHYDSSEGSSYCSSSVSNKVVDPYIDGEQELERSAEKSNSAHRNHIGNGNGVGKHPPEFSVFSIQHLLHQPTVWKRNQDLIHLGKLRELNFAFCLEIGLRWVQACLGDSQSM